VVIEEPRCVCGYVLFRMSQETCPECGREVPEADRYTDARFRSMPGDAPAEHAPTRSEGAAPVAEGEDVVTPHDPQTDW
jgi:hypothetical protein